MTGTKCRAMIWTLKIYEKKKCKEIVLENLYREISRTKINHISSIICTCILTVVEIR